VTAPETEEFAKLLMENVRDRAIASCDMLRNPGCNSVDAKRWRQLQQTGQTDELLCAAIPDCVDTVLFYLLNAIDEGRLQLFFKSSSGKMVDLVELGASEMAGWSAMGGTEGWRARFSKARFHDD